MFYMIGSILKQFVDVDHLLSLCVKIPKCDSFKTAESKITKVRLLMATKETDASTTFTRVVME